MDSSDITIPVTIHMTCTDCEDRRNFEPVEKREDMVAAVYECRRCGHEATLVLGE